MTREKSLSEQEHPNGGAAKGAKDGRRGSAEPPPGYEGSDLDRWHKSELTSLNVQLEDANRAPEKLRAKIDVWSTLPYPLIAKKAASRARGVLLKPAKLLAALQAQGDDILRANAEGMRSYRIVRMIESYEKLRGKLSIAIADAAAFSSTFPTLASAIDAFEFEEVSPARSETPGEFEVLTTGGVRKIVLKDHEEGR